MLTEPGGLKIVAVGSVMTKAWDLLKEGKCNLHSDEKVVDLTMITPGFMEAVSSEGVEFTLVMLKEGVSSAIGGAALGAKAAGLVLKLDYESTTSQLFHYKPYNM